MSETHSRPAELHQHERDDEIGGDSLDQLYDLLLVGHRILSSLNLVLVQKLGPLEIIEECEEDVAHHKAGERGGKGSWKNNALHCKASCGIIHRFIPTTPNSFRSSPNA